MGTRSSLYPYVRKVGGRKFQARVWIDRARGHQNLGLYDNEFDAWQAARRFVNLNELPANVLPKYVRRGNGGSPGFVAKVRLRGRLIVIGPFEIPHDAHYAMVDLLERRPHLRGSCRRDSLPSGQSSSAA